MATNTSTNKNNTNNNSKGPTKADLEAQLELLKAQLALTQKQLEMQMQMNQNSQSTTIAPNNITIAAPDTNVSIVYLSDSMGYASISNMELHFNKYGEEFVLSRPQLDELVGKYRSWFDRGILAISSRNVDVAAAKGVKTDAEYALKREQLEALGKMNEAQIEALWNNTPEAEHRKSIASYFKRKFIEGDPAYRMRSKVDLMNRLTDGAFAREQDELSGRYKITPTDMMDY